MLVCPSRLVLSLVLCQFQSVAFRVCILFFIHISSSRFSIPNFSHIVTWAEILKFQRSQRQPTISKHIQVEVLIKCKNVQRVQTPVLTSTPPFFPPPDCISFSHSCEWVSHFSILADVILSLFFATTLSFDIWSRYSELEKLRFASQWSDKFHN